MSMNIGKACAIFEQLGNENYSDEEKMQAISDVVEMETHISITKGSMLKALAWMLDKWDEYSNKPMRVTDIHTDEYYCPACGAENNKDCGSKRGNDLFCPQCGQALDWGDEEEI